MENNVLKYFDNSFNTTESIDELEKYILNLAVRGKLVPQDLNDEPASELLKKIKVEKETLIKKGEIKKEKPLPEIKEDEIPYTLPNGWKWSRYSDLFNFVDYRGVTPKKIASGIRLITAKNIKNGFLDINPEEFISEKEYTNRMTRGFPEIGDIFFTTEAPLGKVCMVSFPNNEIITPGQRIITFQPFSKELLVSKLQMFIIMSPFMQKYLYNNATGMTAKGIRASTLKQLAFPLPPLNEQKRIVEKIEELFNITKRLREKLNESNKQIADLGKSSLHHLTNSKTQEEFQKHWSFIENNFDTLFNDIRNVKSLRQTILQLAVQGKLIPQDPNDEPASELLRKIKAEKNKLIKEGKIKKEKPLPEIREDEIPYELPDGWEWVRLGEVSNNIHYGYTASADITIKEPKLLRITDIQNNKVNWDTVPGCKIKKEDIGKYLLNERDILIARTGGTI
ncbi:MAG: restriction endonuclease subunit S, partial [Spirochaetes bacterium]|nr:restriction endonuclease subunit S [Spirochaetota bacterium]